MTLLSCFLDINFEKWFDKPGSDDWVVVGVGEVGALVVPAGEVPYHMTKWTFQEVTNRVKTPVLRLSAFGHRVVKLGCLFSIVRWWKISSNERSPARLRSLYL